MKDLEKKVVIWSIDDFNTLGLLRELGPFNIDLTFLIKGRAGYASKSKFCSKFIETNTL